jgi:hypothetical protein
MIVDNPDEDYVEFSSSRKGLLIDMIKRYLTSEYKLLVLPDNYIHIISINTKVLQCRRICRANSKVLIPKYLLKTIE